MTHLFPGGYLKNSAGPQSVLSGGCLWRNLNLCGMLEGGGSVGFFISCFQASIMFVEKPSGLIFLFFRGCKFNPVLVAKTCPGCFQGLALSARWLLLA